ncbi:MAG: RING-H2 finger protein [bacterium]
MGTLPIIRNLLTIIILCVSFAPLNSFTYDYDYYEEPPIVAYDHVIYEQPVITNYYTPVSEYFPVATYAPVTYTQPVIYTPVYTPATYSPVTYIKDATFDYDLEYTVNTITEKHARAKNINPNSLSSYDYREYNDIKNNILNALRSNMYSTNRNYVYNYEIESRIHVELDTFLDQQNLNKNISNLVSTVVSWFSGSEVNSRDFEQKVINTAYDVIGMGPDTIPARAVSDFSDKVQTSLRRLRSLGRVSQDDIRRITREEMQPIIDKITFKSETCPICLERFFSGQKVGITSCGHIYHKDCIYTWLNGRDSHNNKNDTCPVCRAHNIIVSKQETVPWVR